MRVYVPAACMRPLPQFAVARTRATAESGRKAARDAAFGPLSRHRRRPSVRAVGDGGEGSSSEPEEWTEEAVDRMIPRAPALVDQAAEPRTPQYRTRKDKARAKRKQKQADAAQAEANGGSAPAAAAAAAAPVEKPPPLSGADKFQVLEAALNTSLVIALVAVVGRQGSHLLAVNGVLDGAIPDLYVATKPYPSPPLLRPASTARTHSVRAHSRTFFRPPRRLRGFILGLAWLTLSARSFPLGAGGGGAGRSLAHAARALALLPHAVRGGGQRAADR